MVLVLCVLALPEPAPTLAPQVVQNLPATGVGNPITGVLLAFRALDTLLEAIVLVIALIGVWSLAPDRFWGGRPGPRYTTDPDGILAYLARVLPPIGIVVGLYLFWAGADHPGGKFQSATILAAMWMLVQMAGLGDAPRIDSRWVRAGIVVGPLVFVAVGLLGAWTAGAFLGYPDGWAKPMIVAIEVALLPTLVLVLALLLNGAPARDAGHAQRKCGSSRAMNVETLFALCACALVGIGLYGLIVQPHPLRKLVAFNIMGSGVFVLFGALAKRGAAAGMAADPVPQALLITAIVVAFAATAVTVALLLRLIESTDTASLANEPPSGD